MDYKLSPEADRDLEEIFDYSASKFGTSQTIQYLTSFHDLFGQIADNPQLGRERQGIKTGLRSIRNKNHVVFYRFTDTYVRIIRILHGSRDIPQHLKNM